MVGIDQPMGIYIGLPLLRVARASGEALRIRAVMRRALSVLARLALPRVDLRDARAPLSSIAYEAFRSTR